MRAATAVVSFLSSARLLFLAAGAGTANARLVSNANNNKRTTTTTTNNNELTRVRRQQSSGEAQQHECGYGLPEYTDNNDVMKKEC